MREHGVGIEVAGPVMCAFQRVSIKEEQICTAKEHSGRLIPFWSYFRISSVCFSPVSVQSQ